jgi:hypothetical protein
MRIFRSLVFGIVMAILAVVLGTFIELALALRAITGQITGGLGAVSWDTYAPYYAPIGFVAGFYWQFRRGHRQPLASVSNHIQHRL